MKVALAPGDVLRRILHLPKTVECGRQSGIPDCCIAYYCTVHMWATAQAMRSYGKKLTAHERSHGRSIQYIVCPDCLRRNHIVEVRGCPVGECQHTEEQAGEYGI